MGNLKDAKHSGTPLGVDLPVASGVNPRKMIAKQLKRIALTPQSPNVKYTADYRDSATHFNRFAIFNLALSHEATGRVAPTALQT